MPTLRVTAWSWISRPKILRVSPKGMDAKAPRAKNTDTKGASLKSIRSAWAGMKSSFVSILTASASGCRSPRMRIPKMLARLAPIRSCMIADCLRSTQVRSPPIQHQEHDEADRDGLQQQIERQPAHPVTNKLFPSYYSFPF